MRVRNVMRLLAVVALIMALAPVSVGIGDAATAVRRRVVSVRDNFFQPKVLRIEQGTRVRWINRGSNPHTTTSDTGLWDADLAPGQSFSRVFRKRGRFPYHCEVHPEMTGRIVVLRRGALS